MHIGSAGLKVDFSEGATSFRPIGFFTNMRLHGGLEEKDYPASGRLFSFVVSAIDLAGGNLDEVPVENGHIMYSNLECCLIGHRNNQEGNTNNHNTPVGELDEKIRLLKKIMKAVHDIHCETEFYKLKIHIVII